MTSPGLIIDSYKFEFQKEEDITAATFTTKTGSNYRVYFYPAKDYIDKIPEDSFLSLHGYFFGIAKVEEEEPKIEQIDFRIRNTVVEIINIFFDQEGGGKVLIFDCEDYDGKNYKRASCFKRWFNSCQTIRKFEKFDEEIITTDGFGEILHTDYLSILFEEDHPNADVIITDFKKFKEYLIGNK